MLMNPPVKRGVLFVGTYFGTVLATAVVMWLLFYWLDPQQCTDREAVLPLWRVPAGLFFLSALSIGLRAWHTSRTWLGWLAFSGGYALLLFITYTIFIFILLMQLNCFAY